jgi:hypothetical protein
MRPFSLACLLLAACTIEKRPPGGPYADTFDGPSLGASWNITGGAYRIANGELVIDHALNHPAWLTKPIPRDAVIEVDVWSNDDVGDIKLEVWGDGKSSAETVSYTATSYVFIFGGWHNQLSVIARMNEHGADRKARGDVKVEKGRRYHFRIARKGGHIDWQIDGKPFLQMDDPKPLDGPDHAYLGFNDWEAELHFDNLKIAPL